MMTSTGTQWKRRGTRAGGILVADAKGQPRGSAPDAYSDDVVEL